jgi:hypothetical protein
MAKFVYATELYEADITICPFMSRDGTFIECVKYLCPLWRHTRNEGSTRRDGSKITLWYGTCGAGREFAPEFEESDEILE